MTNLLIDLYHSNLIIDFSKKDSGLERVVFDNYGNVAQIKSLYGNYHLDTKHVTHVYSDIPKGKNDELIRLSYEYAKLALVSSSKNLKRALENIHDVGYEGYKKRRDFEGWDKFIPPSEQSRFVLYNEVMTGCPKAEKNPCIFCNVYKNEEFSIVPFDKFSEREEQLSEYIPIELEILRKGGFRVEKKNEMERLMHKLYLAITYHASTVRFFWGGGNIFALKPRDLLKRLEKHSEYFKPTDKIISFGHSRFILDHIDFLKDYKSLGLGEVWVGLESGDDISLKIINKSATAKNHVEAGRALCDANIRCNVTVLFGGIDGKLFENHVKETKKVVSKMHPNCVYFSDLVVHEGTKLSELLKEGKIIMPKKRQRDPQTDGFASVSGVPAWHYEIPV